MDDIGFKPVYGSVTGNGSYKTFWQLTATNWPLDGPVNVIRWQTIIYNVTNTSGHAIPNPAWIGVGCSYDTDANGYRNLFNIVEPGKNESSLSLPTGFAKLFPNEMDETPPAYFSMEGVVPNGITLSYFVTFTWARAAA